MSRNCLEGYCGELTFPWAGPASHTGPGTPQPACLPAHPPALLEGASLCPDPVVAARAGGMVGDGESLVGK